MVWCYHRPACINILEMITFDKSKTYSSPVLFVETVVRHSCQPMPLSIVLQGVHLAFLFTCRMGNHQWGFRLPKFVFGCPFFQVACIIQLWNWTAYKYYLHNLTIWKTIIKPLGQTGVAHLIVTQSPLYIHSSFSSEHEPGSLSPPFPSPLSRSFCLSLFFSLLYLFRCYPLNISPYIFLPPSSSLLSLALQQGLL